MTEKEYNIAFMKFHNKYSEDLHNIASCFSSRPQDVVQNVFIKIHNNRGRFDITHPEEFDGLLWKIVRDTCIDDWRRERTRRTAELGYMELAGLDDRSLWELAELDAELTNQVKVVMARYDRLPKKSQRVIKAYFLDGMTMKDYSVKFGITHQSANNLKNKALGRLRGDNLPILLLIISLFTGPWKN
ncbi:MAG TPA: sigma-70 family RNA polymerase sigma factor [Puia sp.]|jgi:RNA polymerase sigma factor (sigma-70 family)|nr:sigma-70 family RNA polymerase sigma factor [Puia sp.]